MSDNPDSRKIDFIKFYIEEWARYSRDTKYIIDLSKYLLHALNFKNWEVEKLVEITASTLEEVLKYSKDKPQKIEWFSLDKNLNWSSRVVEFLVEEDRIIPKIHPGKVELT